MGNGAILTPPRTFVHVKQDPALMYIIMATWAHSAIDARLRLSLYKIVSQIISSAKRQY